MAGVQIQTTTVVEGYLCITHAINKQLRTIIYYTVDFSSVLQSDSVFVLIDYSRTKA